LQIAIVSPSYHRGQPKPFACPERSRLVEEGAAAAAALFRAAGDLDARTGAEFLIAREVTQSARASCEMVRLALADRKAIQRFFLEIK
jgi:hypothetical protein